MAIDTRPSSLSRRVRAEEDCELVAEALRRNSTLRTLKLSYNGAVGDYGVTHLIHAIYHGNTTLTSLHMAGTGMTNTGVSQLVGAVNQMPRMRTLCINDNKAVGGEDWWMFVSKFLRVNRTLVELDLCGSVRYSDGSIRELAQGLRENHTLEVLGLAGIGISIPEPSEHQRGRAVRHPFQDLCEAIGAHPRLRSVE